MSLCSEVMPDGSYGIVLARGEAVRWLDREDVYLHAMAVMSATVRAEHDAAIFRQLRDKLGMDFQDAGHMLEMVRRGRPPVDAQALQPLGLEPGVTQDGKPSMVVFLGGHKIGQWDLTEARRHALACMELAEAVDRDNGYFTYLSEELELGEKCRVLVGTLSEHMDTYTVVKG